MHRYTAVHFVKPQQLGAPLYFAPGLAVIVGTQGRNLRLQLVAHGPIAAACQAVVNAEAARVPSDSLDTNRLER